MYFPLFLTALKTGLRHGELLGLRWLDVNLVDRRITVARSTVRGHEGPTKSGRVRHVPMPRSVATALGNLDRHGDYVFMLPSGRRFTEKMITLRLERALRNTGLGKVRFHDLRHTYASQLVSSGTPLQAVQSLLGHADLKTTLRYAHLAPDTARRFVDGLDGEVRLHEVMEAMTAGQDQDGDDPRGVPTRVLRGLAPPGMAASKV